MVCNLSEKSFPSRYETIVNHVGGLEDAKNYILYNWKVQFQMHVSFCFPCDMIHMHMKIYLFIYVKNG
jgi:hypothetical protein